MEQNVRHIMRRIDAYESAREARFATVRWFAPALSLGLLVITLVAPLELVASEPEGAPAAFADRQPATEGAALFALEYSGRR
jgi:hypothetical protein